MRNSHAARRAVIGALELRKRRSRRAALAGWTLLAPINRCRSSLQLSRRAISTVTMATSDADFSSDLTDAAVLDGAGGGGPAAAASSANSSGTPALAPLALSAASDAADALLDAPVAHASARGSPLLAIVAGLIFVAAVYFFWRPLQKMGAPLALRRHLGGRGKGRYSSLATDELT